MHCAEFEEQLQQLLDVRTAPETDPDLMRHVAQCSFCARRYAAYATLLDGVRRLPAPLPAGLLQGVLTRLKSAPPRRRVAVRLSLVSGLAAAVVLAVFPLLPGRFRRGPQLAAPQSVVQPPTAPSADVRLDDLLRNVGNSYLALANESARCFTDAEVLLPRPDWGDGMASLPQENGSWWDHLAQPLAPLKDTASGAVKLFDRLAPPEPQEAAGTDEGAGA
ncbi:MAG: hypothetical protein HY000_11760 [Planctomycetes bacterium]|nr:hypothetical protein [Planctomycetota bacterium]